MSCGASTLAPAKPPFTDLLANTTLSTATANARVTMARFTPRTRSAGMATMMPTSMATTPPMMMGIGNGVSGMIVSIFVENGSGILMGASIVNFETRNAEIPANDICANEICPTYPVSTTSDRQMMTPMSVFDSASRNGGVSTNRARIAVTSASAGPP